jgi:ubiquinol-cytochrome c reductase iron-sulfur subunit
MHMSAATIDHDRRRFLVAGTTALTVAGIAASAVPFLASFQPTAAAKIAGMPIRVDLSKISTGEGIKLLWRGTPMWVIRRSEAVVAQLASLSDRLKDPESLLSDQPSYVDRGTRARRNDVLVLTAVCTHLACIPDLKGVGDTNLGVDMQSGFVCPCHNSRFDAAGRVLKGSPAPINLPVPPYFFENDSTLIIGLDAAPVAAS